MGELTRGERLQIMLTDDELVALDDWRFNKRMPSRSRPRIIEARPNRRGLRNRGRIEVQGLRNRPN
jgi:hypothetical protein